MKPNAGYSFIDQRDYKHASPYDLREQARNEARRGGTPGRAAELERLASAKEKRLFDDAGRLAIREGFETAGDYLKWCAAVGIRA